MLSDASLEWSRVPFFFYFHSLNRASESGSSTEGGVPVNRIYLPNKIARSSRVEAVVSNVIVESERTGIDSAGGDVSVCSDEKSREVEGKG